MQPVGSTPPSSRLEQVPNEVKAMILDCLGVKDLGNLAAINSLWKKIVNDPSIWVKAAKKIDLNVKPENAKEEVLKHYRYKSINEVFKKYITSQKPSFQGTLDQQKLESEKYQASVNFMNAYPNYFFSFLKKVSAANSKKMELESAMQFISDGVLLASEGEKSALQIVVNAKNLKLFTFILEKCKENNNLPYLALNVAKGGPYWTPYVKIALENGGRPSQGILTEAVKSIDLADDNGMSHLILLLDYTDEEVRKRAVDWIKSEMENKTGDQLLILSTGLYMIENAPPPTYGGK